MPGSITMIRGESGVGKTSICMDVLKTVKLRKKRGAK